MTREDGIIKVKAGACYATLVLRLINSFTIVASAMAPDSRSDEGAMLIHCDRGATTKTGPFRRNPSGRWGLRAMVKLFMRRNTSNRLSCEQVFSLYLTAA